MLKRILVGYSPILLLLAALYLGGFSAQAQSEAKLAITVDDNPCKNLVCPVMYFGNFMGFHMHMGHKCSDDPPSTVGISSTYKLDLCNCGDTENCKAKCIEIGQTVSYEPYRTKTNVLQRRNPGKALGSSHFYHHYYLDGGLGNKHQELLTDEQIIQKDDADFETTTEKPRVVVKLYLRKDKSRSSQIALHTLKVTPKKAKEEEFDTTIFGVGYEVDKDTPSTADVPFSKIRDRNGKCLLVTHDGYDYMVVLGRETRGPGE